MPKKESALKGWANATFGNNHAMEGHDIIAAASREDIRENLERAILPAFFRTARVPREERHEIAQAAVKALDKLPCNCPTSKLFPHRRCKCAFGTVGSSVKMKVKAKRPRKRKLK